MKKIQLATYLLLLIQASLMANDCYQAYSYTDKHKIVTTLDKTSTKEKLSTNARLHVRSVENNGTNYKLFWLENGITQKSKIDIESIYAPFLIKNSKSDNGFTIKSLKSLSDDKLVEEQLLGIVDILQFNNKNGLHRFINRHGSVEVNQSTEKGLIKLESLVQYTEGVKNDNINYLLNESNISVEGKCSLWNEVLLKEKIHFNIPLMKSTMEDDRVFKLVKNHNALSSKHWFYNLSVNINTWGFEKRKNVYSLDDALANFEAKEQEMKELLKDSEKFEQWVRDNMNFLAHLNDMLLAKDLDDAVSKSLFANLGYIDSKSSSNILSQVTLNVDITEKERFRSLMALKNTSAPMDEELLDDLLSYGLSSQNSGDFIQDATGMLVGTLAKNRVDRSPEQVEKISNAIINAITTEPNKTISLSAAGNMLTSAPDNVVETVDAMLIGTQDSQTRANSAEALSRIERSSLTTENFQELFENETKDSTISKLIVASSSAKDFKSNNQYKELLIKISDNRSDIKSTRIASLEALDKADFGKKYTEKKILRQMMLNEKDTDISKKLKELYRRN